jgi:hypothetical protein
MGPPHFRRRFINVRGCPVNTSDFERRGCKTMSDRLFTFDDAIQCLIRQDKTVQSNLSIYA